MRKRTRQLSDTAQALTGERRHNLEDPQVAVHSLEGAS